MIILRTSGKCPLAVRKVLGYLHWLNRDTGIVSYSNVDGMRREVSQYA